MPPTDRTIGRRLVVTRKPPGPDAAAPAAPAAASTPAAQRPSAPRPSPGRKPTPPPPVVRYETVTAACGHPEQFGLFEDRLDKHRDGRRKKLTERACKACREKRRAEEEAAAAARRAEKQRRTPRPNDQSQRLPDGAAFAVSYDAGKTQWSGTLTVGETVFSGTAGGVFKLLEKLDRQFRESVPGSGQAAPDPARMEA